MASKWFILRILLRQRDLRFLYLGQVSRPPSYILRYSEVCCLGSIAAIVFTGKVETENDFVKNAAEFLLFYDTDEFYIIKTGLSTEKFIIST